MSAPTDRCIRLSDFLAWRRFVTGVWYANPVTGQVFRTRDGREVLFPQDSNGYQRFSIWFAGMNIRVMKHRVIWIAAHGLPPYDISMTIDHMNGDKSDNRIENLQLISQDENLWKGLRKLSSAQAREVRMRYAAGGVTFDALAKEYDVSTASIRKIVHCLSYKEVRDDDPEHGSDAE